MGRGELDEERRFLNKWEMYKALHGEDLGGCHLPETERFSASALQRLLERHGNVYIKPIASWGGHGISRVERAGDTYIWTLLGESPVAYLDVARLTDAILPVYENSDSIVQQTAPLLRYRDRSLDIRVHLQRETDGQWVYAGELVRVSGADSIVSNVGVSGGTVATLEDILPEVLGVETFDRDAFRRRCETIGFAISRMLDEYRVFNEIGLDLGVDALGELWLIEVNTDDALGGPAHELFAGLPDQTIYREMCRRYQARQLGMFKLFMEWLQEENEDSQ